MLRNLLVLTTTCLLVTLTSSVWAQSGVFGSQHHKYRVVTVVDGLEIPWSMTFLPGGDMLVTERPGRLRIVRNGTLLPDAVAGVPAVHAEGQGGLFEVMAHPNFASNHLLYLTYAKPNDGGSTTRLIRAQWENDQLTNVEEIFEAATQGRGHYGGKLAFNEEGFLFLTVGDRQAPPTGNLEEHPAQDPSNHHGTTIRLHDDGRVPEDNPFVNEANARPEIWSYGHRNPQGLAIHPETGDIWTHEHGPQGGDELNRIQAGENYGWPVIGYGVNYGSGVAIHNSTLLEGLRHSNHVWVPSIAASGMLIYTGQHFPEWQGNIFVGGLAGQQLARLTLTADNQEVEQEETLLQGLGRIRDIRQGPDDYIYIATEGRDGALTPIVRLEPAE